MLGLHGMPMFC